MNDDRAASNGVLTIDDVVRKDPEGTTTSVWRITPDIAASWLARMASNRRYVPAIGREYARDMAAGKWPLTGESIKFDIRGNLIDGQHRLQAIILAATPVPMFVTLGLPIEAQGMIDGGRKRSIADMLDMDGASNAKNLAAAIRLAIMYENGQMHTANQWGVATVTRPEVRDWLAAHPAMHDAVVHSQPILIRQSVVAFTKYVLRAIDRVQADAFFTDLATHRTEGIGDPRSALLRRVAMAKERREKMSAITESHFTFQTWNAIRTGREIKTLRLTNNDSAPLAFIRPH